MTDDQDHSDNPDNPDNPDAGADGEDPGTDPRVGSRFGPYRLIRLLGSGTTGAVYEARRDTGDIGDTGDTGTRDRRAVAVKLIAERYSGSPVFRLRMQREAEIAGLLTEPHLVPMHAYGEIDGTVYVETRLIDGTDLAALLKRFGPLTPQRAVAIVGQVAAALDAAHRAGAVHRDVKPENILVTDRGGDDFAYLTDLGVARAADPTLTQVGTEVSALDYLPPERFTGDPVTHRCDVYALAGVLSECLTGSPPYPADSVDAALTAHLTAPPPQPSRSMPGRVPEAFDGVIARGMAKKPADRYRSAGELAAAARDALGEAADAEPGAERAGGTAAPAFVGTGLSGLARALPESPALFRPRRRRRPALLAAAAIVAVAAVAGGYLGTRPSRASSVAAPAQTVLPFTGLDYRLSPGGVALGGDGAVYVTSQGMDGHVLKLPAGSSEPIVLPFSGLHQPQGVAVDGAGAVYVAALGDQVTKLAAGAKSQTVLPFDDLDGPADVAVDSAGNVYVADRGNDRVVKLAAGSNAQTTLPFDGLGDPHGVAVDGTGTVYVTDTANNRVLKLPQGAPAPVVLPLAGIAVPWGVSVDNAGNVYVTEHDSGKVVKLTVGSPIPSVLPFTGLNSPSAVVVGGNAGDVYVADRGNDRVLRVETGPGEPRSGR